VEIVVGITGVSEHGWIAGAWHCMECGVGRRWGQFLSFLLEVRGRMIGENSQRVKAKAKGK
jgi:hypothetical protein